MGQRQCRTWWVHAGKKGGERTLACHAEVPRAFGLRTGVWEHRAQMMVLGTVGGPGQHGLLGGAGSSELRTFWFFPSGQSL